MDTVNSLCYSKDPGFPLGIFSGGGGIYYYANFFCYAIVFGPNFREGQKFSGGQTASGRRPLPSLVEESQRKWGESFHSSPLEADLTLNRPGGGGGIRPQAGSFLCCAETVSSRKLKLSDFYYILIGLNSEYKAVPWDIHCCHGNAIVEGCSVKFWLKSVENCIFQLKLFSNLSLGLLFVISISKLPPIPNFKQIRLKTKKLGFSAIF